MAAHLPSGLSDDFSGTGRTRPFALAQAIGGSALVLSVGLPLLHLATALRSWENIGSAVAAGRDALGASFLVAAGGATVCAAAALVTWRWRHFGLSWFLFLLPGVVLGLGAILLFNAPAFASIYPSIGWVVCALAARYGAVCWSSVRIARHAADPAWAEVLRLEGAARGTVWRRAWWPQISTSVFFSWYATYLLCLWDTETLLLILPPGWETLSLRIFNLLHYGHHEHVNVLCLTLLALALAPWLILRCLAALSQKPLVPRATLAGLAGIWLGSSGCQPADPSVAQLTSPRFGAIQVIGTRGTAPGQFNKPRSLTVDREDRLYVADMTGRIQRFTRDGAYLGSWSMPETDLGKPKGMCCDPRGHIVVLEPHYQRVNHFTPEGQLIAQWGQAGNRPGELTLPRSIAVTPQGDFIVSEYTQVDRVQRFSGSDYRGLACWGSPGREPGQFNRAEGVAVDAAGRVYVADSCNHRIQVFSAQGEWLHAYGRPGPRPGELSYPYDICLDQDGLQYVCEFGNSRVQIFDPRGVSLETLGGPGSEPGRFHNPWSITLDSQGNLYVADAQNHRVQKFVRRHPLGPLSRIAQPAGAGAVPHPAPLPVPLMR